MSRKAKYGGFRDDKEIVELIDEVCLRKGIDRSNFIREAIRKRLASLEFLLCIIPSLA